MSRVLLIGWDGADWRILDPLLEAGVLPNLAALIDRGGRAVLRSTIPTHSWTAWPSFLTGVDPADHGVFDIPEWRPFTHPEGLAGELEAAGCPWPINGMSWTTYRNRPQAFLEEVRTVTAARQKAMEHLLDTTDWRVACFVYFSTDRIQH